MGERLSLQEQVPLAQFSTLGVGGPARHYLRAQDADTVAAGVRWAAERGLPLLLLGGGSNLVISDHGFEGLVLHLALRSVAFTSDHEGALVHAAAGEPWDELVEAAVERGWGGMECLSGIPGSVGATPIQNVGAYGQDVSETITHLAALDTRTGETVTFTNEECGFGYRDSRFKREDRGRYVILGVTYVLQPGGKPALRYPELARHLEAAERTPTLAEVRRAVIELRRRKSMVVDPEDPNRRSVGSFFMNPLVDEGTAEAVRAALRRQGREEEATKMPAYPAGARVKLSAAWLIERAGVTRGYGNGRVGVSTNHTLALVNRGEATAAEVVALAREVRARVRDAFGITLVPEPVFVNLEL
ncbi:MAG TPA: UDP-N-acetylmuramate dehydrogenase [Vicinamibacteria bacterium]|nr:UDP-N-acetylmuramate dehydrogenase [Vicinamibacteria bacterium]